MPEMALNINPTSWSARYIGAVALLVPLVAVLSLFVWLWLRLDDEVKDQNQATSSVITTSFQGNLDRLRAGLATLVVTLEDEKDAVGSAAATAHSDPI